MNSPAVIFMQICLHAALEIRGDLGPSNVLSISSSTLSVCCSLSCDVFDPRYPGPWAKLDFTRFNQVLFLQPADGRFCIVVEVDIDRGVRKPIACINDEFHCVHWRGVFAEASDREVVAREIRRSVAAPPLIASMACPTQLVPWPFGRRLPATKYEVQPRHCSFSTSERLR